MKYVLMFTSTPELDEAFDSDLGAKVYEEIFAWFGEHSQAGRIVDGGAELQPVSTATTLRGAEDGAPVVVDGPFSESKEVVGGFAVVDVPDLDAAIELARSWPSLRYPGNSVEVRPIVDHSQG